MADKVKKATLYRIKQIERAEAEYYKTLITDDEIYFNLYQDNLQIGYSKINKKNKVNLIKAFQRKYRQSLINGKLDQETYLISKNVLNIK